MRRHGAPFLGAYPLTPFLRQLLREAGEQGSEDQNEPRDRHHHRHEDDAGASDRNVRADYEGHPDEHQHRADADSPEGTSTGVRRPTRAEEALAVVPVASHVDEQCSERGERERPHDLVAEPQRGRTQ